MSAFKSLVIYARVSRSVEPVLRLHSSTFLQRRQCLPRLVLAKHPTFRNACARGLLEAWVTERRGRAFTLDSPVYHM
jgi:hypothetical protein